MNTPAPVTTVPTLPEGVAAGILARLGFRTGTRPQLAQALAAFQEAVRLDADRLTVDGQLGPRTSRLLVAAEINRRTGRPTASAHFSYEEFRCSCRLTHGDCRGVWVRGALLDALEVLRAKGYGDGLHVIDGYRCPTHNEQTAGAAADSQHPWGAAADIAPRLRVGAAAKLGVFSGLGWDRSTGCVSHVDVRGVGPVSGLAERSPNPSGGTVARPSTWMYER